MVFKKFIKNRTAICSYKLESFRKDVEGVAAMEFAILAPLMLVMYIGTIEISSAISANRKISRAASTIGDLIAQIPSCYNKSVLDDIVKVADDIIAPFDAPYSISLTGVDVDANGNTSIAWNESYPNSGANSSSGTYSLPSQITQSEGFIIAAKINMAYTPIVGWATAPGNNFTTDTTALNMEEELYLRPRVGDRITTCP